MLDTFGDPKRCGQLIVALPEEMPLRESLELDEFCAEFSPKPGSFLLNRRFPRGNVTDAVCEGES